MQNATLLIGADLAPTRSNFDLFNEADVEKLVGAELVEILSSVDVRIFNLECPLTDTLKPILKCGPNLIAPTSTVTGIKALNPTVIGLSNNHILDQDEQGLFSTINQLKNNNIAFVGAGQNLDEAKKPHILTANEIRIGIYACAEHEFTIATNKKAGANPFDPFESLDHIEKLKAGCDYVIVLYHGGKEHYQYPSPYLQKTCRKIAEKGANAVICQHSHCIGCFESYKGSTIIYGQGNFIFDASDDARGQTGLIVKITIGTAVNVEYIPIQKKGHFVELANEAVSKKILEEFYFRSAKITEQQFIETEYEKLSDNMGEQYLRSFAGYGRIMNKLDILLQGITLRNHYNPTQRAAIRNFIECEAHREVVLRYLSKGHCD